MCVPKHTHIYVLHIFVYLFYENLINGCNIGAIMYEFYQCGLVKKDN